MLAHMSMRSSLLLVLLSMAFTVGARADLAPPPPGLMNCPEGAYGTLPTIPAGTLDGRGRPMRPWPYCAATTCTSDADCTGGLVCSAAEIGLCMEDHEVVAGTTVRQARDRVCEPDGTCLALSATCERARRCVAGEAAPPSSIVEPPPPPTSAPPITTTPPPTPSSCDCRAATGSSNGAIGIWLPLALLLLRRLHSTRRRA